MEARNLGVGQTVTWIGFEVFGESDDFLTNAGAVLARDNDGVVWIQTINDSGGYPCSVDPVPRSIVYTPVQLLASSPWLTRTARDGTTVEMACL